MLFVGAIRDVVKRRPKLAMGLFVLIGIGGYFAVRHGMAWQLLRQAERATAKRDLDAAEAKIGACRDAWPQNPAACLLAARIARLRQQSDDAFRLLEEARKLGGDAERIVLERYLLRAGRGELDQVEKKLLAFLAKEDPDSPFIMEVLTYQWRLLHRLSDALPLLEDWHRLQPDLPDPVLGRAWVLERLRDYAAALSAYQQALDLDPDRDHRQGDRVRLRLAELMLDRLRPQEAAIHFEVLVDRQSANPAVMLGLARCRLQLGRTDEGVALLGKLLRAEPNHGRGLAELGRALFERNQLPEAEAYLRQALAVLPADRQVVFALEQCLQRLGKNEEARTLQARLERIRADERLMAELMTDVQRSPADAVLRQRIGEVFLRNGLVDDGLLWLDSALFYDEHLVAAHEVLAEWYESRGAADKAVLHRQLLARLGVANKANRFLEP